MIMKMRIARIVRTRKAVIACKSESIECSLLNLCKFHLQFLNCKSVFMEKHIFNFTVHRFDLLVSEVSLILQEKE